MPALLLSVEYGLYGANYKPLRGALWRASFYDAERGQFYAGSADCPWEAVAWALVEREQRIANGNHPSVARVDESPAQALARLRGAR